MQALHEKLKRKTNHITRRGNKVKKLKKKNVKVEDLERIHHEGTFVNFFYASPDNFLNP